MVLTSTTIKNIRDYAEKNDPTLVRKYIRDLTGLKKTAANSWYKKIFESNKTKYAVRGNQYTKTIESKDSAIKTLDQLLEVSKVDLENWRVDRLKCSSYGPGFVSAEFKPKKEEKEIGFILDTLKEELSNIETKNFPAPKKTNGKYLYEIAVPDIHIGRLVWGEEVGGSSYDSNIAIRLFKSAVVELLNKVDIYQIEKILFPIGNDYYNSNSSKNVTFNNTEMTEDSRWQDTFKKGAKLAVEMIEYLSSFVPVDVVICVGNHDTERSYYLGEYLCAYFRNSPNVTIDNSPVLRKYYKWKKTLISLTHGSEEKISDLPLIMAAERPEEWAQCTYKMVQIGHFHRLKSEDFKGVVVETIGSLAKIDQWHHKLGYVGAKQFAEGFLFDPEQGLISKYFYYSN